MRRRLLLSAGNPIARIRNQFKNRVANDGGILEAESCLDSQITSLRNIGLYDKASLILIPNGYKASKLYSLKPIDGIGDFTFTRASSKRRSNASGLIEALPNNVPAIEYPIGGGCPSNLMEPQRTNLDPNSATFASYDLSNSGGCTALTVAASNPFNYSNVVKIIPNAVNGQHRPLIIGNYSSAGRIYCVAKADGYSFLSMGHAGGVSGGATIFNLATGTISTSAGYNPVIRDLGNGWYWCEIDADAGNISRFFIVRNANNTSDYVGNGTSGILFCHKQLEVGAFGSSPIVTSGGTVTRISDTASATGISSLIGQNEGTVFLDFVNLSSANTYFSISADASLANVILLGINPDGQINARIAITWPTINVNVGNLVTAQIGVRYKVAFSYSPTECILSINGVSQKVAGFSGFTVIPNRCGFDNTSPGSNPLCGLHRPLCITKSASTEAELNMITTL